ncbi:MAG: sulfotransferase family 2 domain-containing protein, partial [Planctomycetia bacterium]|nr:sulfotransferase family 2 domain-containing protein [Planctomycetia bacterium]
MLARTVRFTGRFGRACLDLLDGFAERQPADRLPDDYRRIYQYHIPKTGGTSLNYMFLSLGGEDGRAVYQRLIHPDAPLRRTASGGKVFVGWDARLIEQGRYFYAFSHLPRHRLRLPARTFTVTCLRDPVRRVVSLYRELVKYRSWNADHPCRATTDAWLGASFRDFLHNIPRHELLAQLAMFSPRLEVGEALDGILACSFAFRTEDFAAGCAALGCRLHLPLTVLHARQSNHRVE